MSGRINWGRVAVVAIGLACLGAAGGIWYTQNYAYYEELAPETVSLTVVVAGAEVPLAARVTRAIDAGSAPHRWRACGTIDQPLPEGATPYPAAAPTHGPGWFDCFLAEVIGRDLLSGAATAYLSQGDIHHGIDRVIAVYPDGRVFGWHQITDALNERGVMD
ncbi:MAG: DUF6446 family protein [Paracoccus sp. (in: a-proteobacteria)]|nr:DUF6446 family protein [Paracoccus sp. (in: a-proteobacteria)]